MIPTLDPSTQHFLNTLSRIAQRMERAQRQIATGRKIAEVTDAPSSVSLVLAAQARFATNDQKLDNLGRVKTEVDAAEQALQNAVSLFDTFQTLAAQGATDTQTAASRNVIAQQIDGLLEQMVGLADTAVEGRYIFAGDTDQQVPYTYNPAQANPVSAFGGALSTRTVVHPNGTTFSIALTAQEIFDSSDPTTNVFAALRAVSEALKNNDGPAIRTAMDGLGKVSEFLNGQLAFYGVAQNKVNNAINFGNALKLQLQTQIAGFTETDLSQAVLELNQAQIQQEAALAARAKFPKQSLFDYLG